MQTFLSFRRSARRRQRGSTLILVVFVVALIGTLIGVAMEYTAATATATKRAQEYTIAQGIANGALEALYKRWQVYMSTNQVAGNAAYTKAKFDAAFVTTVAAQINNAVASSGYKLADSIGLTVQPVDLADNPQLTQSAANSFTAPLTDVPGWMAKNYSYRARAIVQKIADPTAQVSISRYFSQSDASLYQAMLFFQDDLELHPGATMTLYGLVHTNSNLYAVAGAGSTTLTFTSNVSFHGNQNTLNYAPSPKYLDTRGYVEGVTTQLLKQETQWANGNYNQPIYSGGTRTDQLANVKELNPIGIKVTDAIDKNNPNASGTHEIIERPAPFPSKTDSTKPANDPNANTAYADPDAFNSHRAYNTAGLRVFINHDTAYSTTAINSSNKSVTVSNKVHVYKPDPTNPLNSIEIVPTGSTTNPNIADGIISSITTDGATGDITDMRELRAINASTVDVSVLTPALNKYSDYNGVVYITDLTNADLGGNTGDSDAIRLKKGGVLPGSVNGTANASGVEGMTIVSDGAVYVQGDYNTGTTYVASTGLPLLQPDSNTKADPTKYTVSGYTQKPAAVMGDAVMILSNSWVDGVSGKYFSGSPNTVRVATPTTMNAAIVSGAVVTSDTNGASGGAHNFPRFLEDWGGKNFTYHGSMCELYQSIHFDGTYGKANVYSPPSRRWFFDDSFLNAPPPGNLRTTTYGRGRWTRNTIPGN